MRPTPLGLIVLGMLIEQPMHVYRMQKLIQERGKDKVVNVRQRTSLHQVVDRLITHGLVEEIEQRNSSENYPERRVYRITTTGRQAAIDWLGIMVTELPAEFPQFPAALSVLTMVSPDIAIGLISARVAAIETALEKLHSEHTGLDLPRIFLLEDEYLTLRFESEAAWLEEVLRDIDRGLLVWQAPDTSPHESLDGPA
ncbi:MAG TPA: helix-turn-helix transcriptional regulator [Galbitalea sp.]|jgi:DNA-binding PadR family transcriptional regulator|nr:helix-turn-helix transcriptional regulator [Galbitalea sp.]